MPSTLPVNPEEAFIRYDLICAARIAADLTLVQAAELSGFTGTSRAKKFWAIETGFSIPRLDDLYAVCMALDLNPFDVIVPPGDSFAYIIDPQPLSSDNRGRPRGAKSGRRAAQIDWSKIDWSKRTSQICLETNALQSRVSLMRRKHAPDTARERLPNRTFINWDEVNWKLKNKDIAIMLGVQVQLVSLRRFEYAPETRRNPERKIFERQERWKLIHAQRAAKEPQRESLARKWVESHTAKQTGPIPQTEQHE